jgi:hypothetical protein
MLPAHVEREEGQKHSALPLQFVPEGVLCVVRMHVCARECGDSGSCAVLLLIFSSLLISGKRPIDELQGKEVYICVRVLSAYNRRHTQAGLDRRGRLHDL